MKMKFWWTLVEPEKIFEREVSSLEEAEILYNGIAFFCLFLNDNHLMRDYSNMGGLDVFNEKANAWEPWEGAEGTPYEYMYFDEYIREKEIAAE